MKTVARICIVVFVSSFAGWGWTDVSKSIGQEVSATVIDFPPGTLPFPDGTNITNQFQSQGVIFSADDSDLPPEFQVSQGSQENLILQGTFFNLFRLNFTTGMTVESVSVTFGDQNSNSQAHTLTAFDRAGNVVDRASFTENTVYPDIFPDPFTLTVSSCQGIAFVVAIEQPLGAERVERIAFTQGGGCFDVCIQDDSDGNLLRFSSTTGDYQFTKCGTGLVLAGTGSLIKRGGVFTLQQYAADRRVLARVDTTVNRGTASVQIFSQGTTFTITDRNTTNNTCGCCSSFLSFVQGNPGPPGDGVFISARGGIYFDLATPIRLSDVSNGFTYSVFLPTGSPQIRFVQLGISNLKTTGSCRVYYEARPSPSGNVVLNGAPGVLTNVSPAFLDSILTFVNSSLPGCGVTLNDLYFDHLTLEVESPSSGFFPTLDAASICPR
ncbi:MAG TPA: hypothetical protein VNO24_27200 [Blastocatellia bacterium]|nr:hypothetical protein [Blastocatellia bacterium]